MTAIYFPPTPGLIGSDPRDWYAQRFPATLDEARAMVALAPSQELFDAQTNAPILPIDTKPETVINITGGREQTWWEANQWWALPAGFVVLFVLANR